MTASARITRLLLAGQGISSFGDGIWITIWVIYFTEVIRISPRLLGIAAGAAGLGGILIAYACGLLSEILGARRVLIAATCARGIALLLLCIAGSTSVSLVFGIILIGFQGGEKAARSTFICSLFDGDARLTVLAKRRVVQHLAYAVGSGAGAAILAINDREIYLSALALDAVTFFVLATLVYLIHEAGSAETVAGREPEREHRDSAEQQSGSFLFRYSTLMFITAIPTICWAILTTGMPLWIHLRTAAPSWLAGVIIFISSIFIAGLQLQISRQTREVKKALHAGVAAGVLLGSSCVIFAAAAYPGEFASSVILLIGCVIQVFGELYYIASRWLLSVNLMDSRHPGKYQGITASSENAIQAIGPAIVVLAVTTPGAAGWAALSCSFIIVGAMTPACTRWVLLARHGAVR